MLDLRARRILVTGCSPLSSRSSDQTVVPEGSYTLCRPSKLFVSQACESKSILYQNHSESLCESTEFDRPDLSSGWSLAKQRSSRDSSFIEVHLCLDDLEAVPWRSAFCDGPCLTSIRVMTVPLCCSGTALRLSSEYPTSCNILRTLAQKHLHAVEQIK